MAEARSARTALPGAVARAARAIGPAAREANRRASTLLARLQPAALAFGRAVVASAAPPRLVYSWLAGVWVAQALAVVCRLEIADRLKDGPKSCEDLAAEVGAHAPSLYRLMRALASLGLFAEDRRGRFATTRLGRCLERDAPDSIHPLALMVGAAWHWQAWGELLHTVRTGESAFVTAMGQEAYAYFAQHPADGAVFSAHVEAYARQAALAAAGYDFADARVVVDVGGGYGAVLAAVLGAHPTSRGILFDLPDVIAGARPRIEAAGLAARCELVAGSFFDAVPAGGDVYLLSSVLHNWDDARAVAILRSCRRAMADGGRLLLVELVLPPGNTPSDGKLLDLQMMVLFAGGRERSAAEYRTLLAEGGFRLTRVMPTRHQMSLIEAVCQ